MDYHDPFSWKKEAPIPVEQYTVRDHQEPQDSSGPQNNTGPQQQAAAPKAPKGQRFGVKVASLCLACALLGGVAGGTIVNLQGGPSAGGSNTTVFTSGRPQVELETVLADGRTELTPAQIYAAYADSCVAISVETISTGFFRQTYTAAGSGFVVTEDGYIVTNYHVVEDANKISVTFENGTTYDATYVGGEESNDIAVIKIDVTGLTPVVLGNSDQLSVGEAVVTIGNPLGELSFSLSNGVVSALNRTVTVSDSSYSMAGRDMNMIQTNCTINSGNSGGPLFNQYGEVIGIVSAKYSSDGVYSNASSVEGLGFAIPMNDVMDMITDIIENGYVTGKPFLGISVASVTAAEIEAGKPAGAEVIYAAPGLCAANGGILEGDIITAVGDAQVTSNAELIEAKNAYQAGEAAPFTIYRNGETLTLTVTLDEENTANSTLLNSYVTQREEEALQEYQAQQNQRPSPVPNQDSGEQAEPDGGNETDGDDLREFYNFFGWPFR